jgi:putative flippase GtrA
VLAGEIGAPIFLARVCRWALAGGGSLALQLAIQGLLIGALAMPARAGIVLAYELALVLHFLINDRWVFSQKEGSAWRRLAAFHASALIAEGLTLVVAFAVLSTPLAALLGPALAPCAATIAGTGAAAAITFSASFFWIWRPARAA